MSYSFLASPYSDSSASLRHKRYEAAKDAVTWLLSPPGPIWCFSPIVYCHPLAIENGLQTDADTWTIFNQNMIEGAADVRVLLIPGWDTSRGVQHELQLARQWDKPIIFMRPFGQGYRQTTEPPPLKKSSTRTSQLLTQGGGGLTITPIPSPVRKV